MAKKPPTISFWERSGKRMTSFLGTPFSRSAWKEYRLAFLFSGITLLALATALAYFLTNYIHLQREQERTGLQQQIVQYQRGLELSFTQQANQHNALASYVVAELNTHGYLNYDEFQEFAASIVKQDAVIRFVSIAPDGMNQWVFPMVGNESIIGQDLISRVDPQLQSDLRRAIDQVAPILAGPYPLGQGQTGLIIGKPVIIAGKYWGLTGIMVNFNQMLAQLGLDGESAPKNLALRDDRQNLLEGDASIFAAGPVILPIEVQNHTWELAAIPAAGWGSSYRLNAIFIGLGFGLTILFIAAAIFTILSRALWLQKAVADRTQELESANQALKMISACNEALVRASTDTDLLSQICATVIDIGGYCRVWAGYLQPDQNTLKLAASAGHCEANTREMSSIGGAENSERLSSLFETLRSGNSIIIGDIEQHPFFSEWKNTDPECACTSAILLPLMNGGECFGALIISSESPSKISVEKPLLEQLAQDLAYGLTAAQVRLKREEAERSLERQNSLLTRVMDTSPAAILMLDTSGHLVFANSAAEQMIGVSLSSFSHSNVTAFDWQIVDTEGRPIPPEEIPFVHAMQERKPIFNIPLGAHDLAGRLRWILLNVAPVITGDDVEGVIMNITEITELRETQTDLVHSESRYRQLFESVQEGIWVLDTQGITSFANEQMGRILGCTAAELVGQAMCEYVDQKDGCMCAEALAQCQQGTAYRTEAFFLHSTGRRIYLELHFTPIYSDQEQFTGALVLATDVSTRRQRESELGAIARIAKALRGQTTRAEIVPTVLNQMMELVNGQGALLAVMDEENDRILFESALGVWEQVEGIYLKPKKGVSYRVFREGTPYMTDNILLDEELASPDLVADLIAQFCVPLLVQGKVIGCVWVGRRISTRPDEQPPTQDELNLLLAAGDIASSAMYRATLNDEAQLRVKRLTALRDISLPFMNNLDAKQALEVLLDHLTQQFNLSAACVLRVEESQQMLFFAAGRGFPSLPSQGQPIRLTHDLAGQAVLTGLYLRKFIPDLSEDSFDRGWLNDLSAFHTYEAVPLTAHGQIKGVLELFHSQAPPADKEWLDFLRMLSNQTAIALENTDLVEQLQNSNINLTLAYDATIKGWSQALELRDQETEGHSQRVVDLVLQLAARMGVSQSDLVHIRRGALLHDIGKMAIPDRILFKTGELSPEEWAVMRKHPEYAFQLLSPIAYLQPALDIPHYHHERWDGSGYPLGLKGQDIPLAARIFSIVDVWDALLSDRVYSSAWSEKEVRAYLRQYAGSLFDPEIVEVFLTEVVPDLDLQSTDEPA